MTSLIELQKSHLLFMIKGIIKSGGLYILIIDSKTELYINKLISKDQLLRIVTSIELIDAPRKQNKFLEAIYLVESSIYNFNCIKADASASRYKIAHSLFSPFYNPKIEHQFSLFVRHPQVNDYFNNGLNIHFGHSSSLNTIEQRCFTTTYQPSSFNSMPIYFNENCRDYVLDQIKSVAQSLVNLMVISNEYPLIRFYYPNSNHEASRLSELIADEFQNQIDEYARENIDFPTDSDKPRSILLIVDRTIDLFAPLLHDFSYQALAMDIVNSLEREGIYNYQSESESGELINNSSNLLNEFDLDWINLRHLHIIEASELIINKINDLIINNPLLIDRSKASTTSDLATIMATLKGFDQERKQLTLHKTLIDEILEINAQRKLAEFAADFEQTCAAKGVSFEGIRNKNLHDDLIILLARDDLHVNDKMRLVLIYGLYRGGLVESDFIKLVKFIGVNDKQIVSLISRCFNNFHKLGYPIVKKDVKDKKVEVKMFHTINNEGTYNTSRYSPGISNVLFKASKQQLDEESFPYFRDKPVEDENVVAMDSANNQQTSLRNQRIKASWATPSNKAGSIRPKQRVFCYIAGGMTYTEMKSVYKLSEESSNKEFFIGSECILKPRDFLIGLQSIDQAKSIQDLNLGQKDRRVEPPAHLLGLEKKTPPIPQNQFDGNNNVYSNNNNLSHVNAYNNNHQNQGSPSKSFSSPGDEKEKKKSRFRKIFK